MGKYEKENLRLLLKQLDSFIKPMTQEAKELLQYIDTMASSKDDVLYFKKDKQVIPFSLLSNKTFAFDRKTLLNPEERGKWSSYRSLRIAATKELNQASILVGVGDVSKCIIRYKKGEIPYIIDYANNLIMEESLYMEIFPFTLIEEIPAYELGYLEELIDKDMMSPLLPYLLICYKEMKEDIKRHLKTFAPHFYASGIHEKNKMIFSMACENMFLLNHERFDDNEIKAEIYDYTMKEKNEDVIARKDKSYQYANYVFYILSDYIAKRYRADAKSVRRNHRCIEMSLEMLWYLSESRKLEDLWLIRGHIPLQESDVTTHFWVEFKSKKDKNKRYALDYTGNVIMESEEYISLIKAKDIHRINYKDLIDLFFLLADSPIRLDTYDVLYFAEEITRDLEKNRSLFKNLPK